MQLTTLPGLSCKTGLFGWYGPGATLPLMIQRHGNVGSPFSDSTLEPFWAVTGHLFGLGREASGEKRGREERAGVT